jgi:hypothetical protein
LVLARAAHSGPKFTINSAPKFTSNSAPKFTSNSALHARRQSHHHSPRLTSFLLPSRLPISSAKGRSRPAPASPRAAQHRPGTTSSSSTDSMPRNRPFDAPRRTLAAIYPILVVAPPDPFNVAPGQATNPWRRGWLSRRCARASWLVRARRSVEISRPRRARGRCSWVCAQATVCPQVRTVVAPLCFSLLCHCKWRCFVC